MSAAATKHVFEDTKPTSMTDEVDEMEALEKLTQSCNVGPVIAIDLDDVLSQTNLVVSEWHNEQYGTKMTVHDFYYYYYWKNPYWGTVQQTFDKVKEFYKTPLLFQAKPVPGAREGVLFLKDMGYRLIIVTARGPDTQDESWEWVTKHFSDCFESIICTGQFEEAHKTGHEVVTKLSKAEVCADLGAMLLIDDSAENAIQCATALPKATQVLLFGDYQWNKRISGSGDVADGMSYDIRFQAEGGRKFWEDETLKIPDGWPLERVKDWTEVVRWIQKEDNTGRM